MKGSKQPECQKKVVFSICSHGSSPTLPAAENSICDNSSATQVRHCMKGTPGGGLQSSLQVRTYTALYIMKHSSCIGVIGPGNNLYWCCYIIFVHTCLRVVLFILLCVFHPQPRCERPVSSFAFGKIVSFYRMFDSLLWKCPT